MQFTAFPCISGACEWKIRVRLHHVIKIIRPRVVAGQQPVVLATSGTTLYQIWTSRWKSFSLSSHRRLNRNVWRGLHLLQRTQLRLDDCVIQPLHVSPHLLKMYLLKLKHYGCQTTAQLLRIRSFHNASLVLYWQFYRLTLWFINRINSLKHQSIGRQPVPADSGREHLKHHFAIIQPHNTEAFTPHKWIIKHATKAPSLSSSLSFFLLCNEPHSDVSPGKAVFHYQSRPADARYLLWTPIWED